MIQPTVTFWRSLRTSSNANDEPLAKICFMACDAITFVSRLIQSVSDENSYTHLKMFGNDHW